MKAENSVHIIRLYDLLETEGGEGFFSAETEYFESKNPDVESFFKEKAVQATKLNTAATYLVISYKNKKFDILGYFTLAIKMLTLKQSVLSKRECREISRFGYFDDESESYKLPAILIAQFSRNFHGDSESMSGADLMGIALDKIRDLLHSASGKAVFLECEQEEKIVGFYENAGFQPLGNTVLAKNNKELTQLYMIL